MPESPREQFLEAAATVLRGMTGPRYWGTAYPQTLTVERVWRHPNQVHQFPHLCLLQESGAHVERFLHDADEWMDRFRIVLYGYVAGDETAVASTWIERLNRDCKLTLRAAMTPPEGALVALAGHLDFDEEEVEFEGALGAYILPMTVRIPDNLLAVAA